jgi:benzoate transport
MNLANHIDQSPMTRYQMAAITLCMVINMLDGFDVLVVAFTAPSIAKDWGLSATSIGTLLSAGLVGMTLGSLLLGPLADRFGRRPMVLFCLAVISLGMLLSAFTQDVHQLTATRLLTGLGIGGILPSLNTIVAEFSSHRWRSFSVSFLQAGYPVGATLGGMLAAVLITHYGWRAVYALAGIASTAMIFLVWRYLPESLEYLVSRQPKNALEKINRLLSSLGSEPVSEIPIPENKSGRRKTGYSDLLGARNLLITTVLLSLAFFIVMLSFYFVLSWTPKILVDAGMSTQQGISGGVLLNVGGIVGSLLLGYLSSRMAISKLIAFYMCVTAGLMVLFSNVTTFDAGMQLLTLGLGFFIFGSIVGLYALSPHLYPVQSRSAGLSIAIGVGRVGGVTSPLLAGYLFDHGWAQSDGFIGFAAPLLISAIVVLAVSAKRN